MQLDLFIAVKPTPKTAHVLVEHEFQLVPVKGVFTTQDEYLEMVNAFYRFWLKRVEYFDDSFLTYFVDTPLKDRLSLNEGTNEWILI